MRKQVRFFCSYASKDSQLVGSLLDLLLPHLKASREHEYVVWEFHKLVAGDRWHERIQDEIAKCDFGMLFLSPEFLASDYVKQHELAPLLRSKGILPIGLKPVDLKAHDLQTLDDYQLFRLRMSRGELRWFSELRGRDRDAFALELFRQIEAASAEPLLARYTEAEVRVTEPEKSVEPRASVEPAPEPAAPLTAPVLAPEETFFEQQAKLLDLPRHIVEARGRFAAVRLMGDQPETAQNQDAVNAVPYLMAWVVSGSYDKTVRVWDAASGESVLTLEGHGGGVSACAVSPDGRRIVSGSYDKTVRVWDAASGESVLTLEGHGGWVTACAVSPDGRRIVSGSEDKTVRVWARRAGRAC